MASTKPLFLNCDPLPSAWPSPSRYSRPLRSLLSPFLGPAHAIGPCSPVSRGRLVCSTTSPQLTSTSLRKIFGDRVVAGVTDELKMGSKAGGLYVQCHWYLSSLEDGHRETQTPGELSCAKTHSWTDAPPRQGLQGLASPPDAGSVDGIVTRSLQRERDTSLSDFRSPGPGAWIPVA